MLHRLLVGFRLGHGGLHEMDAQEALVRVPVSGHHSALPRQALLPAVVLHVCQMPWEGRLVGEDPISCAASVVVVIVENRRLVLKLSTRDSSDWLGQ